MRTLLAGLALALVWSHEIPTSEACTCPRMPIASARKKAVAIFSGRVVGKVLNKKKARFWYTFRVSRVYKGKVLARQVVWSEWGPCGLYIDKGKDYLVYAIRRKGAMVYAFTCTRTRELRYAAKDLKALGKGRKPIRRKGRKPKPKAR